MKQLDMFEGLIPEPYEFEELPHDYYWTKQDEILATMGQACYFDNLPESEKGKAMWLACPCPKCSPRC